METLCLFAVIRASIHSDEIWRGFPARRSFERVKMKIRMIALAGVAALALSAPAMAADDGWYLGLGGGWDQQNGLKASSVPSPALFAGRTQASTAAIIAGTIGYSWNGLRLEDEIAWDGQDLTGYAVGSLKGSRGYNSVWTDYINAIYDIPLDDQW